MPNVCLKGRKIAWVHQRVINEIFVTSFSYCFNFGVVKQNNFLFKRYFRSNLNFLHRTTLYKKVLCMKKPWNCAKKVLFTSILFIILVGGLIWTYFSIMALVQIEEECYGYKSQQKKFSLLNHQFLNEPQNYFLSFI